MKKWILLLFVAAQVQAQKSITDEILNEANGSRLEVRSVFDPMPPTGYAPLRIVATNGSDRDMVWSFNFNSQTQEYNRNNTSSSSLDLPVAKRSTQSALFLMPLAVDYGNSSGYRNDGHTMTGRLSGPFDHVFSNYDNRTAGMPAIAISRSLANGNLDKLEDAVEEKHKSGGSYYGGSKVFGSRFAPLDLPEDWLGLSGFDYFMLTDADWQLLKPGSRNALLQWVRLGGRLHIYSKAEKPEGLPANQDAYSLGQIETIKWNGQFLPSRDTLSRYWKGSERVNSLLVEHAGRGDWPLLKALGDRSFNSWQVVVFLVLFGILVGPVNLFVLAPSGRRHRLFVTTPLLSLGASVLMVGIILFQDGIGGLGARYVFINLEPGEATAYVTQKQVSRTGVLFGAGFDSKQAALIEPLALPDTDWVKLKDSTDAQPVNLTLKGASHSGNYFQSRAEQAQMIRMAISTRARLEVQPGATPEAAPILVSALGFTVDEMFYADAQGSLWMLKAPLATGQKAELIKTESKTLKEWWNKHKAGSKMKRLDHLMAHPEDHFFATAARAPGFTLDTLSSIRWQKDEILIYGSITPP